MRISYWSSDVCSSDLGVPSPCGGGSGIFLEVSIMSTIACDTPHSALDEPAWQAVCKTAAEHAQRGCGLAWEHWVTLFSSEIDAPVSRLPESQRPHALRSEERRVGKACGSTFEYRG